MGSTVISEIERRILSLPEKDQVRLLSRVSETIRKRREADLDEKLAEMASDPQVQRVLQEINIDFLPAELDGLPE